MSYIKRYLERKIQKELNYSQVILLTGPRQSGKSTLLQHLFDQWEYVTFDNMQLRYDANNDPSLFLKKYPNKTIFDEAQKVPNLFHEVKLQVDNDSKKRFILSGSSNFLLMANITESLAGRTAICELYPFSISELQEKKRNYFLEELKKAYCIEDLHFKPKQSFGFSEIINSILLGGFPKLAQIKKPEEKIKWFRNYQTTVVEKDFRDFIKLKNLQEFNKLYCMLAFQTGSLVNYSNLSSDLGISAVSVREYINLLVTSYQFFLLPSFYKKLRARLIKTPKIYSYDTGLSNFLENITDKEKLLNGGRFGDIFENWVITELVKQKTLLDVPPDFYFWRTSNGQEIDLIIDCVDKVVPIEIKSSAKLNKEDAKHLLAFMDYHKGTKTKIPFGLVIYLGDDSFYLTENIMAVPVGCIV